MQLASGVTRAVSNMFSASPRNQLQTGGGQTGGGAGAAEAGLGDGETGVVTVLDLADMMAVDSGQDNQAQDTRVDIADGKVRKNIEM